MPGLLVECCGHLSDSTNALTVGSAWHVSLRPTAAFSISLQDSTPRWGNSTTDIKDSEGCIKGRSHEIRSFTNRCSARNTVDRSWGSSEMFTSRKQWRSRPPSPRKLLRTGPVSVASDSQQARPISKSIVSTNLMQTFTVIQTAWRTRACNGIDR